MKKHILFTSRDVGAAHQIKYVVKEFKKNGFHVSILGSGAAYEVFKKEGLNPRLYSINGKPFVSKKASRGVINELLKSSYKIITRERPDAVFCGLTTFGYGIDEAIMYWAASKRLGIPAFQFLDTWGTFNHFEDGYPDLYFAIDRATEYLGSMRAMAPIRIVGSPKHFAYSSKLTHLCRESVREKLHVVKGERLIGYFGQLPSAPGHTYNFKIFIDAVKKYKKQNIEGCKLLMRPHPAYSDKYKSYRLYLEKSNIDTINLPEELSVEEILCACDIIATCYSTVAVDHAFLSCYSKVPLGVVLYLLCGEAIKKYLFDNFGFWKNPLLEEGIGLYVYKEKEVFNKIKGILNNPFLGMNYFRSTKFLRTDNPSERIMDTVFSFLS